MSSSDEINVEAESVRQHSRDYAKIWVSGATKLGVILGLLFWSCDILKMAMIVQHGEEEETVRAEED